MCFSTNIPLWLQYRKLLQGKTQGFRYPPLYFEYSACVSNGCQATSMSSSSFS